MEITDHLLDTGVESPQPLPCLIETWSFSLKGLTSTEELNNRIFPPYMSVQTGYG